MQLTMINYFIGKVAAHSGGFIQWVKKLAPGLVVLILAAGCQTEPSLFTPAQIQAKAAKDAQAAQAAQATNATEVVQSAQSAQAANASEAVQGAQSAPAAIVTEAITLREGDVLKISFPGSPNLNKTATIRRDGMISLDLVGEVKAAGKTPADFEKELLDLYSTQLVSKQVTVEVQSSSFPVYISGSVLRPGRIVSDHPITALEAIMEAGGFDYVKADLKQVQVTRREAGGTRKYILNLKREMDGKGGEPFYLKPADIIYVPEKFNWF